MGIWTRVLKTKQYTYLGEELALRQLTVELISHRVK